MGISVYPGITDPLTQYTGISMDGGISSQNENSSTVSNALLFGVNNAVLLSIDNYIQMPG